MFNYKEHILPENTEARTALRILDKLYNTISRTLFIVDDNNKMVGSLTDGDIRRGLLNDLEISHPVKEFMNKNFKCIYDGKDNVEVIKEFRALDLKLIPLLNQLREIIQIVDLTKTRNLLPLTALIMAGGRGIRLKPFTDTVPKPMLLIGNKPLLEHNIDRLIAFGVSDIFISVKYLKNQIMDYFGDGSSKGIRIYYIEEDEPLGTLGAMSLIEKISHDDILVMNSDLLTNIDFEDFYKFYKKENADMAIASIPYVINVPYAVLEINHHEVSSFTEKPTYTYYSNGGIYLLKFSLRKYIPKDEFSNATDFMDKILSEKNRKLIHYPLLGYWLDIGQHTDYIKAQDDIKHLKMD